MAKAGETLSNPVTGERVVARVMASETNGAYATGDYFIPAGLSVRDHFHPGLEERLEIRAGHLRVWLGGEQKEFGPGESVVIPRGARHHWRNDGEDEVHVRGRFEPALRFEEFFESYFVIAAMGRSMRSGPLRGSPRPLQAAVLLHEYRDEIVMSMAPPVVQRLVLPPLAALGRLLGCRARYQIEELGQTVAVEAMNAPSDQTDVRREGNVLKRIAWLAWGGLRRAALGGDRLRRLER